MRTHKHINDPKTLLEQGKIIVAENADNKFIHRVSMVNLLLSGMSPKYYLGSAVIVNVRCRPGSKMLMNLAGQVLLKLKLSINIFRYSLYNFI